jgi:hypothetical protein
MKKILPVIAVPIVALGLVGASASASPDHHQGGFQLTGKVLDVAQLDLDKPGQSLGDEQIITMDVFQGDTRVGESHVACTLVRVEEATHAFTAQCDNVTSLPAGQITAQGLVTSAQEETTPFHPGHHRRHRRVPARPRPADGRRGRPAAGEAHVRSRVLAVTRGGRV